MVGKKALKLSENDNVATLMEDLKAGEQITVTDKKGTEVITFAVHENIPFGHKVAVQEIPERGDIIKYGEKIGMATVPIQPGFHVHVHNLESIRGRGDWEKGAS